MSKKSDALLELVRWVQHDDYPQEYCEENHLDGCECGRKYSALARAVKAMVEESGRHINFNGVPMLTDAYRSLVSVGHAAAFPEDKT